MRFLHPCCYILLVLYLFSSCCSASDNTQDKSSQQSQPAQPQDANYVTQVLDGDTFILSSGRTMRIALIDTPESGEPLYDEATHYLVDLILGRKVSIKPVGKATDRYDRTLAEVYIDTINVGYRILSSGLAYLYLFRENLYLKEIYLPAQIQAIRDNAGLWALPAPVPEEFYVNLEGSYRFHRPLCIHLKKSNPAKIQRFASREDALIKGFSPCRTCKP